MNGDESSYVLVTPAKNEAGYIERTIESVLTQSLLPKAWVIVDDGSSDATGDIAERYAAHHPFIRLLKRTSASRRNFASKAYAVKEAYEILRKEAFAYFGNLDADIVLPPRYYETMIECFKRDSRLGIVGGLILDRGLEERENFFASLDSVGSAVQFFRRSCYEEIGGYLPLPMGGEDAAAEILGRMKGWKVKMVPDVRVVHLRATGQGAGSIWRARYATGIENYLLGYDPLFFILKTLRRVRQQPVGFGSLCMLAGYLWSSIRRRAPVLPPEAVRYLRNEQRSKIKTRLFGKSPLS